MTEWLRLPGHNFTRADREEALICLVAHAGWPGYKAAALVGISQPVASRLLRRPDVAERIGRERSRLEHALVLDALQAAPEERVRELAERRWVTTRLPAAEKLRLRPRWATRRTQLRSAEPSLVRPHEQDRP